MEWFAERASIKLAQSLYTQRPLHETLPLL